MIIFYGRHLRKKSQKISEKLHNKINLAARWRESMVILKNVIYQSLFTRFPSFID